MTNIDVTRQAHTMTASLFSEASALIARAKANGFTGPIEDIGEWHQLNSELGGVIPAWYIELVTSLPLVGLEFGWQSLEPEGEDDGVSWMEWLDVANVRLEMLDAYPGIPLLQHGYLCIAGSSHGSRKRPASLSDFFRAAKIRPKPSYL